MHDLERYLINPTSKMRILNKWEVWPWSSSLASLIFRYLIKMGQKMEHRPRADERMNEIRHTDYSFLTYRKTLSYCWIYACVCVCVCVYSITQLHLTLFCPMDYSSPGSPVHRISQARILEWVAISFSRGSCQLRDWTWVSHITGRFVTILATRESQWHRYTPVNRHLWSL